MDSEREHQHASKRDEIYVDHLERRRSDFDRSMWQAPALTIAAQAFLLRVLTDQGVCWQARLVILLAGAVASFAAAASLIQLRRREVEYSEGIAYWFVRKNHLPDPRPAISSD
jgi:hypothetical protein